jgi:hypothetical protein
MQAFAIVEVLNRGVNDNNQGINSPSDGTPANTTIASVKLNSGFKFHYDENLGKTGLGHGYVSPCWKQL